MLCRLAGKQQWVIMPVTNSGYGVGEKGKFCTEDTPLRPISSYGVTKVKAEEAVLVARKQHQLPPRHRVWLCAAHEDGFARQRFCLSRRQ